MNKIEIWILVTSCWMITIGTLILVFFLKLSLGKVGNYVLLILGLTILIVFVYFERKTIFLPALIIALFGGILNCVVVTTNGLIMPSSIGHAVNQSDFLKTHYQKFVTDGNLLFLGDNINLGNMFLFSIGDIIIIFGFSILFITFIIYFIQNRGMLIKEVSK